MTQRSAFVCFALFGGWLFVACNAGDVTVFSDTVAGAAGNSGGAGLLGAPAGGGSSSGAGAASIAGGGDTAGATSGAGGSLAGGGATGGGSGQAGACEDMICHGNPDCPPNWLCNKAACQDMTGICEPRPVCLDSAPAPVCGCNHVTYWNDCLRMQAGIAASTIGECGAGTHPCYMNGDCPPGASCSHLLPPMTACGGPLTPGTCWVTPSDCSATGDPRIWAPCAPPGSSGGSGPCVSTCKAVQSGHPHMPLDPGAACPGG
jgi:hypothetical protein